MRKSPKSKPTPTETVLVLRTCDKNLQSYVGFQWPESGYVEAPDWKPTFECGNGLHGLPWGEGCGQYLDWSEFAKWLVVEVTPDNLLHGKGDLHNKCKFRCGTVVYSGAKDGALAYLQAHGADMSKCVGGTATAGDRGTATARYRGTATAGYRGTATAGDDGTATAGDDGTATAGYRGTATAGNGGTATAGDRGTATAGIDGTATAGDYGTATAGNRGTATAGLQGILGIKWWDGNRYRVAIGYVGEDGILPNVAYQCHSGKFVAVSNPTQEADHA